MRLISKHRKIAMEEQTIDFLPYEDWIGVDFDKTLVTSDKWRGVEHIGEPIMPMINFIKDLLSQGNKVKIFTARVSALDFDVGKPLIEQFCMEHFGQILEITNVKDLGMTVLYDDRARQVIENEGIIVEK